LLNLVSVLPAKESLVSQEILSEFEPHVRLDHCVYREQFHEPASCFIIKSQSTGSRTIVTHNELPDMTLGDFHSIADKIGHEATWFHFEARLT
jgi:ketohexokinase